MFKNKLLKEGRGAGQLSLHLPMLPPATFMEHQEHGLKTTAYLPKGQIY